MQTTINNNDTGLVVRTALNNMFTELYGNISVPKKLTNVAGNTTYLIVANTFVSSIEATSIGGTPTLRIGTTANGTEMLEDTVIGAFQNVRTDQYFTASQLLYFTVTGAGTLNIRIDQINNYF